LTEIPPNLRIPQTQKKKTAKTISSPTPQWSISPEEIVLTACFGTSTPGAAKLAGNHQNISHATIIFSGIRLIV